MTSSPDGAPSGLRHALAGGLLASALSTAVLAWRGQAETGSAAAPLNAVSHWVWGDPALRRDDTTVRHTLVGTIVHSLSALLWAAVYAARRERRTEPTVANALTDALAVALVSAVVDLRLVPERLTPGFEHRLSRRSLIAAYGSVALGLALAALPAARRPRRRPSGQPQGHLA
jgi:hypothetical protein